MTRRRKALLALLAIFALLAAACGSSDNSAEDAENAIDDTVEEETESQEPDESEVAAQDEQPDEVVEGEVESEFRAAFILVAPVGDVGLNFQHDLGRQGADVATGIETAFVDSVPEGGSEFDDAVQNFIDDGFNVIVTTWSGYQDATLQFANDNPDVTFENISGSLTNETNMGNTNGRMYQPRYIAGMAAGAATESDVIGYVAAFPIPEVIRGINAFALGVQATNPDAVVEVDWTSTWFGIPEETASAQSLIDAGADVLTMHQDSTATGIAISEAGGTFIGYHSDMSAQVENYLTAPVWDFTPRYTEIIETVLSNTYTPELWWGGMADGIVDIEIPESSPVAAEMQQVKDSILAGEFDVFDQGDVVDQDGTVIISNGVVQTELTDPFAPDVVVAAEGDALNDDVLLTMSFFVDNVVGELG